MQVQVQGQLCSLGGGQAEASEEGVIQGLSLRLDALGGQQKALAQDRAHTSRIGVVPKHRAEL